MADLNDDSSTEERAPDVIASIYKSMSQIIEVLNTDNLLLNRQVDKIRGELEFVCNTLATLKMDTHEISTTCTVRSEDLLELKKKLSAIGDLQKHVVETRNMLIQTLDVNIKSIKKELGELRNTKDNIRPYIKTIVEEEVKQYISMMPTLERRFEALEREQRTLLANHIRKSTIQARSSALQADADNISQLIKEERLSANTDIRAFMEKIEEDINRLKLRMAELNNA